MFKRQGTKASLLKAKGLKYSLPNNPAPYFRAYQDGKSELETEICDGVMGLYLCKKRIVDTKILNY